MIMFGLHKNISQLESMKLITIGSAGVKLEYATEKFDTQKSNIRDQWRAWGGAAQGINTT